MSAASASSALDAALAAGDLEKATALARRLADDLARMRKAIGDAAAGALAGAGGSSGLEKARGLWSEALEQQSRSLEAGREARRSAMEGLRKEQAGLLAELAGRQKVLVSSAADQGRIFPAEALREMRGALSSLESGGAEAASSRLSAASGILRNAARSPGADAPGLASFAEAEDSIRQRLESAPKSPAPLPGDALCRAASIRQAGAR
ncbi:MAG: hypothetical protein WC943_08020, partial [Elusimicrobiota bacterium]